MPRTLNVNCRLKKGDWISPQENVILDIDEDFFGCEAAETRFKQVRLYWLTALGLSWLGWGNKNRREFSYLNTKWDVSRGMY